MVSESAAKGAPPETKKVFVFLGGAEVNELLCRSIESRYLCECQGFTQVTELVKIVKAGSFDLAVIDFSLEEGMVALELVLAEQIPVVLFHPEGKSPELRGPKRKVFREDGLLAGVDERLKEIGAVEVPADNESRYLPLGVPFVVRMPLTPADIFVKISASRFVKLFHKGSSFTPEESKRYLSKKKLRDFHLRKEDVTLVHKTMSSFLEAMLKKVPRKPKSAPVDANTTQAVEVIHDLARNLGFTPEVQKLVKNSMDSVLKEMEASPSLSGILAGMERDKGKYITSHSRMLAEVSCALAIAMEWGSDTSLKKIAMASLLHDMCLTDQKLCMIKDVAELDKRRDEFTLEQQEEYKTHTKRAALLIQGMKEVPADVDKIVYQHHELPKGTGFPEAVSHIHIHPLAATLAVAHDLVDWVIDHPGPIDIPPFVEAYKEKYSVGAFKKILKALEGLKLS